MNLDWLVTAVQENQVMQAALVAAPATALTYAVRNVPGKIWKTVRNFITYDLTFRSDMEEYYYVSKLVCDEIVKEKWSRKFTYDKISLWNNDDAKSENIFTGMSIGYGRHLGSFEGRPVFVHRVFEEEDHSASFKETLTLSFIGRNNKSVESFCRRVSDFMDSRNTDDGVKLRRSEMGGWMSHGILSPRPLNTVFTNDNLSAKILEHLTEFSNSRDDYIKTGTPYHTGVLLYGPPGSGKTSLVHAIATELGRNINYLNLSGVKDDKEIASLIGNRTDWKRSILVIEDIDAAKAKVSRESETDGVSLASLLNILDGFLTPEGMITFATTNHPEKLDPALTRSGRFDIVEEMGPLCWDEAKKMADLLLPKGHMFYDYSDIYAPVMGSDLRKAMIAGSLDELFSI